MNIEKIKSLRDDERLIAASRENHIDPEQLFRLICKEAGIKIDNHSS